MQKYIMTYSKLQMCVRVQATERSETSVAINDDLVSYSHYKGIFDAMRWNECIDLTRPLSLSSPVLSPIQVLMAWRSPPPPIAPVHSVDDGILHRPITCL